MAKKKVRKAQLAVEKGPPYKMDPGMKASKPKGMTGPPKKPMHERRLKGKAI